MPASPFSAMILRAAGAAGMPSPLAARSSAGAGGAAAGLLAGPGAAAALPVGAAAGAGWPMGAAALPSIAPSTAPTATVLPCGTLISDSTPALGAGTSTVTLSVSSSTRGSSTATASPGFLNHCPTVASVTDSPSAGTVISMAMSHLARASSRQGLSNERFLLFGVPAGETGGGGGGCRSAHVGRTLGALGQMLQHPLEIGFHEAPCAHVLRFLLRPNHIAVGEAAKLGHQRAGRKRIVLLDPQQIDVIDAGGLARLEKVVVDLARTQHDPTHVAIGAAFAPRLELGIVPEHAVKRGAGPELGQFRGHAPVPQQRLGRHDHQGLAKLAVQLPAQDVEVVGRRGAVDDLPVVLGTQLQEAFEAGGGMLRALPFVAVRQQAHQPGHA